MKRKLLAIFMVSFTLTTIFSASVIVSAAAMEDILIFVMDGNKPIRNADIWGESPDDNVYYESIWFENKTIKCYVISVQLKDNLKQKIVYVYGKVNHRTQNETVIISPSDNRCL